MTSINSSDYDDPSDWTIDRVVQEFCWSARPTWSPERPPQRRPDPALFEKALRDNDIDGDSLLALEKTDLEKDLGVSSFGQKRTILKAIDCLRGISRRYQQSSFHADAIARGGLTTPQVTHSNLSPFAQSPALSGLALQPSSEPQLAYGLSRFEHLSEIPALSTPTGRSIQNLLGTEGSHHALPRGVSRIGEQNVPLTKDDTIRPPLPDALEPAVDASSEGLQVSLEVSRSAADVSKPTSEPRYTTVNGRKRVVPKFVSHITETRRKSQKSAVAEPGYSRVDQHDSEPRYLGKHGHKIEEIFYPTAVDEDFELNFVGSHRPIGQTKGVGSIIKHYLRQPTQRLPGSRARFRVPCKRNQILSGQDPHYFTMFSPGLSPAIRRVEDWSFVKAAQILPRSRGRKTENFSRPDTKSVFSADPFQVAETPESDLRHYEYLLEKYPQKADHEDVLPLYGDSGDEGEYDEETWIEIEKDIEENKQAGLESILTREEVERAVDEAIVELKNEWRQRKLAKVQLKGYRLWMKAFRGQHRQAETDNASFWVARFGTAIKKIREAISKDTWHKATEVKRQCQSVEESVFQYEEYCYYVQVLNDTQPPMLPSRKELRERKPKERPVLSEGEEVLDSDTDVSMDDFLDDDDDSDGRSIPHDDPNQEQDATLTLIQTHTIQHVSDKESISSENHAEVDSNIKAVEIGRLIGPAPELKFSTPLKRISHLHSDSEDERVISPADRKRMSQRSVKVRKDQLRSRSQVPRYSSDETSLTKAQNENDSTQDSDLDLPRHLPNTTYRDLGATKSQPVDLTLSSSPSAAKETDDESAADSGVRTPALNPAEEIRKSHTTIRLRFTEAKGAASESSNSSPRVVLSQPYDSSDLPNPEDVEKMRMLSWETIEAAGDSRRALAKALYGMDFADAKKLKNYVENLHELRGKVRETLKNLLVALLDFSRDEHDEIFCQKAQYIRSLPLLFVTYLSRANRMNEIEVSPAEVNDAYEQIDPGIKKFMTFLRLILHYYCKNPTPKIEQKRKAEDSTDFQDELSADRDLLMQHADSDEAIVQDPEQPSSHKKRKRTVAESQEAKSRQQNDQIRVQEEERRRKIVAKKLEGMAVTSNAAETHIVNTVEPYVYLDPHIGQRVKPHQVEGISFMWREIITDPKQQGCLLAHTMGLGKTMQVISLLVTIAQCGKSTDLEIRHQIPDHLKEIRALILCPPSLIDNWHDELLMWVPKKGILGEIRKITTSTTASSSDRLQEIKSWVTEGGILIIGYEMFRNLVLNLGKKLTPEEHEQFEDSLLNGPNIIVADEAHKMKNPVSKIAHVAKRLKSKSRIALTGSPLNNHLEEYHTMVDWIAPGYLGDIVQFKAKYSEPINEGLYVDSTSYERRVSLRKLHVLKRDLDPKISRADISAIEKDMPSKIEFFITIPLTELQANAYDIFVAHILQRNASTGPSNARLWDWLAILVLLCNHPSCFVDKLQSRKINAEIGKKPASKARKTTDDDDESSTLPEDVAPSNIDVSVEALDKAIEVFSGQDDKGTLTDVKLSYRSLIVLQILEESIRIGDKVLIFSHSIPTLDYLENMLDQMDCKFSRIDGGTSMGKRQESTKAFNKHLGEQVFLISMRAGGLGLNLQGANRVIIYDFGFNPAWEEQAIGRAYRLGQNKPVFVYRFRTGGTFEEVVYNTAVFKTQLFQRVVDKRNPMRHASKTVTKYLFLSREVEQQVFTESLGKDPEVLDRIIQRTDCIRNIELTETFQKEDEEELTPEERMAADEEYADQVLERNDPEAFQAKRHEKMRKEEETRNALLKMKHSTTSMVTPASLAMAATRLNAVMSNDGGIYPRLPGSIPYFGPTNTDPMQRPNPLFALPQFGRSSWGTFNTTTLTSSPQLRAVSDRTAVWMDEPKDLHSSSADEEVLHDREIQRLPLRASSQGPQSGIAQVDGGAGMSNDLSTGKPKPVNDTCAQQ